MCVCVFPFISDFKTKSKHYFLTIILLWRHQLISKPDYLTSPLFCYLSSASILPRSRCRGRPRRRRARRSARQRWCHLQNLDRHYNISWQLNQKARPFYKYEKLFSIVKKLAELHLVQLPLKWWLVSPEPGEPESVPFKLTSIPSSWKLEFVPDI